MAPHPSDDAVARFVTLMRDAYGIEVPPGEERLSATQVLHMHFIKEHAMPRMATVEREDAGQNAEPKPPVKRKRGRPRKDAA